MNTISPLISHGVASPAPAALDASATAASVWLQAEAATAHGLLDVRPASAPLDLDAAERDFLAALCSPSPQAASFG